MLYHLQDIQLGSSDDVYAHDVHRQLLYKDTSHNGIRRMGGVGIMHNDVSRKILGAIKRIAQMLPMYG